MDSHTRAPENHKIASSPLMVWTCMPFAMLIILRKFDLEINEEIDIYPYPC